MIIPKACRPDSDVWKDSARQMDVAINKIRLSQTNPHKSLVASAVELVQTYNPCISCATTHFLKLKVEPIRE